MPPDLRGGPAVICLVLTVVNPTHDPGGELLGRYIDGVTQPWRVAPAERGPLDAVAGLEVVEAAQTSAATGQVVAPGPGTMR